MTFKFEAYDVIACSTRTTAEKAAAILDALQQAEDSVYYPDFYPPMARYWRELVFNMVRFIEDDTAFIALDYYVEVLQEHCDELLPDYTGFTWVGGELRVQPCIELVQDDINDDLIGSADELPDDHTQDVDHFAVITDHGNLTLYKWECVGGGSNSYYWVEVWSAV